MESLKADILNMDTFSLQRTQLEAPRYVFPPYSSNTLLVSQRGQPPYKGQKAVPKCTLFGHSTIACTYGMLALLRHVCMYIRTGQYAYVCVRTYMYVHMYVRMFISTGRHTFAYVCA